MDRRLRTVPYRPNPARALLVEPQPGLQGPCLRGEGGDNLVCGGCGRVLVEGVLVALLTLYLCCPGCGAYNVHDGHERGHAP